jgi:anti-sigma-K factor RskA
MSDQLEPELERVAQMLANAGPLPDAPASLRARALRIPDAGDAAGPEASRSDGAAVPVARRSRRRPRPLALAGLAAAVAAIAIVPVIAITHGGGGSEKRVDLAPRSFAPKGGGAARLVTHDDGSATINLSVWKMPDAGSGRTYEAWLGRKGDRLPLGTFRTDAAGKATVSWQVPPGEVDNYRWLWVTSEPKGGSSTPSDATALWGPLT